MLFKDHGTVKSSSTDLRFRGAQNRRAGPVVFGLAEALALVDHRQQPAELLQSNILSL